MKCSMTGSERPVKSTATFTGTPSKAWLPASAAGVNGYKHSLADGVVHATPADAPASETEHPNKKSRGIPDGNHRHLAPEALLLHPIDAHQPRHSQAKHSIGSQICDCHSHGRLDRYRNQRPRQSLGEDQPEMSPGTHMPHHRHPAQPLEDEFAQGPEVCDCLNRVRKQFDFISLL